MCGVAGIVHLDGRPVDCTDIKRMTDAIAHRGPDGEGQCCEGPVGLGHRRLAIIDLSEEASQPMASIDGRYVITYNGEVYNFRELKRELEKSGSRFRTQSDTEVVLEAVVRWGIDTAIRRFNGMFAFAIWDRREKSLLLGRDRYGIKPLYIWRGPDQVAFASEPKAFRSLGGFVANIDVEGIAEYFTFQNIWSEKTFLRNVTVFPPGHWGQVRVPPGELDVRLNRYWEFDFTEDSNPASAEDYGEELRRLLRQAVGRQLVSDVEVGAYLSGGLDSGSIVAFAAHRRPMLKTFTVGFELESVVESERHFDERTAAETISSFVGTTQFETILGPRHIADCLEDLAYHLEEPRVGQSYPNYYAARLASRFVKVVLAGTGGDEILGGYPWRYPPIGLAIESFQESHFRLWNRLLAQDEIAALMRPVAGQLQDFDAGRIHEQFLFPDGRMGLNPDEHLARVLYFECKTFLPGLLAVEDRLSMAFGLETRVPFLDNDLVDFAQTLPQVTRLNRDRTAAESLNSGKRLLRRAMMGLLPEGILQAPKQGFSSPDTTWFATHLQSLVASRIGALPPSLFDSDTGVQLWRQRQVSNAQSRLLAWSLIVSSIYLEDLVTWGVSDGE